MRDDHHALIIAKWEAMAVTEELEKETTVMEPPTVVIAERGE